VRLICIGENLGEKRNVGAGVLGICPELYAPPGGTSLAAKRHIRVLGSGVFVHIGNGGINLHHMEWEL